ncbi:MAG: hypothetical protein CHACPFDD_00485 [Phycisphaerae bacterium]|nr:hypothetical protein [Phycisphaerae bacterium]
MKSAEIARLAASLSRLRDAERGRALAERLTAAPRCPVARFVAGCDCFERGQAAVAVRHVMIAHHAEPDFESAALLAFAGLNWVGRPHVPILSVVLATWDEFRRPEFDRTARERALLDAFAVPSPPFEASMVLARRLWRLPIRTLREQLRQAGLSQGQYPILFSPA